MDYKPPVYCYETPPQEPRYSVEGGKNQHHIEDGQENYWDPISTSQVNNLANFLVRSGQKW